MAENCPVIVIKASAPGDKSSRYWPARHSPNHFFLLHVSTFYTLCFSFADLAAKRGRRWKVVGEESGIQYGPFPVPKGGLPIKNYLVSELSRVVDIFRELQKGMKLKDRLAVAEAAAANFWIYHSHGQPASYPEMIEHLILQNSESISTQSYRA
ncbi:Abscisic acid 8'-hydroxylase 2, partial [Cucurbita argyrosperma subsp. argyrosperma]